MTATQIGVVGAGTMGIGIAYTYATKGFSVLVVEPDGEQQHRARQVLRTQATKAVGTGRLDPTIGRSLPDSVDFVSAIVDLPSGLPLVIEAVPERLDIKLGVLGAAAEREPQILASNTSGIGITDLAGELRDPSSFIGMHFFNPVWSMKLVEIIRGAQTSDDTLSRTIALASAIDKTTIVVNDAPGFATSRLGLALGLEAIRMVEDGVAAPADIDTAMELGYRHPMGPLKLTDVVGLDVRLDIARNLEHAYGSRFTPPQLLIDKVAAGELGKKSGRGFYEWP